MTWKCPDCGCADNLEAFPVSSCRQCNRSYSCQGGSIIGRPHYQQVGVCAEDCEKTVFVEQKTQSFRSKQTFAMPSCGAKVQVVFEGVTEVAIGAWMWAFGIGYLEVTGFNSYNQTIELKNPCPTSSCGEQAAEGTPIASCTDWVLTPPPCAAQASGAGVTFPYLAVDFTAPANSNCIQITVTNVNGLSAGKLITIGGGTYRVSAITSATLITICNDGSGLPSGTPVIAKDSANNYITPIVLLDSNPCLNAGTQSGQILVCDSNVIRPFQALADKQVPVWDSSVGRWFPQTLGVPTLNCTALTADFTTDGGATYPEALVVTVASSAGFSANDLVLISGIEFTVFDIVDATHLRVIPLVHPSGIVTYHAGTTLCSADCCSVLQNEFDNLIGQSTTVDAAAFTAVVVNTGSPSTVGNLSTVTIANSSTSKVMHVFYDIAVLNTYQVEDTTDGHNAIIRHGLNAIASNSGSTGLTNVIQAPETLRYTPVTGSTGVNPGSKTIHYNGTIAINPGDTLWIKAQALLDYLFGNANVRVTALGTRISAIGVAVQDT